MKSGLQQAALARLAKLTQNDHLPPETQTQIRERLLKRCTGQKKLLPNGVNVTNGLGSSGRFIVQSLFLKFPNFELISE